MKLLSLFPSILIVLSLCSASAKQIKVACIGDSITYGAGIKNRAADCYPAQLQHLLGKEYKVVNFGVNGKTMLSNVPAAWTKTGQAKQSISFQPDIVVIKLGSNDAKPANWEHKADFLPNTLKLIEIFKSRPNKPRIILCTPIPAALGFPLQSTIANEVVPEVRKAAAQSKTELVDLYREFGLLGGRLKTVLPDSLHPNAEGASHIALRVADQILSPRNSKFSIEKQLNKANIKSSKGDFKGFKKYTFKLPSADNAHCVIVAPNTPIQGQPWIWRARFFGHQPRLDLSLLERGFHVCYCDIAHLFGSPTAVQRWDHFYKFTQKLGLDAKPILEGMSRGGLIITNWAKANPKKVSAIYGDNPVCDIRSWPAKKSPNDWKRCLQAWNKTVADMPDFKGNPIDGLEALAKEKVPFFLVLGKKDDVVPLSENAYILAENYKKLGGEATIWEKPNGKHHPHGLHPVFPLLRHLLHATGNKITPSSDKAK